MDQTGKSDEVPIGSILSMLDQMSDRGDTSVPAPRTTRNCDVSTSYERHDFYSGSCQFHNNEGANYITLPPMEPHPGSSTDVVKARESESVDDEAVSSTAPSSSKQEATDLEAKDGKYRERRKKNNMAAKKSRDARRVRENQLKIKVLCLENANQVLRSQVQRERDKSKELEAKVEMLLRELQEAKQ